VREGADRCRRGRVLGPVRQHEAQLGRELRGQEAEELVARPIDPVQVLEDEHGRPEPAQRLEDRAEQPMAIGARLAQRLERRRQFVSELRERLSQRSGHRIERSARRQRPGRAAERLDERSERERLTQVVAVASQEPAAGEPPAQLPHEPGLADPRLPLDKDERRRTGRGAHERLELIVAADQRGRGKPAGVSFHT
jgi:hypothetical protein